MESCLSWKNQDMIQCCWNWGSRDSLGFRRPDGVLNLVILFSYGRKCLLNATMIFERKRKSSGVVYVRDV